MLYRHLRQLQPKINPQNINQTLLLANYTLNKLLKTALDSLKLHSAYQVLDILYIGF